MLVELLCGSGETGILSAFSVYRPVTGVKGIGPGEAGVAGATFLYRTAANGEGL